MSDNPLAELIDKWSKRANQLSQNVLNARSWETALTQEKLLFQCQSFVDDLRGLSGAVSDVEITDEERLAAVRAIQSLGSYTWERVIDIAVEAINDCRRVSDNPQQCAQCGGPTTDDEPMDFGPFRGRVICDDCWANTDPQGG